MKTKLILLIGLLAFSVVAQPTINTNTFQGNIPGIIAAIDESSNLFPHAEIEARLGGVYVQKTGEAGTLIALEKWDLGITNLGVGIESITSGQDQAAEFAYVTYRKPLGNVAGSLFVGGGYSDLDRSPLAVVGARLEYRTSKHLGIWTSLSEGILTKAQSTKRGMVVGAGVSYAF